MFTFLEVKGAATDASASDKDIPEERIKYVAGGEVYLLTCMCSF